MKVISINRSSESSCCQHTHPGTRPHNHPPLAVNELLRFDVVLLDPLQCQNESASYAQDSNVLRKPNVVIVDNSTNNTSQDAVLNLFTRRRRSQVAFSRKVDDNRQGKKANE